MTEDIQTQVRRLGLVPGDIVVVESDDHLPMDVGQQVRSVVEAELFKAVGRSVPVLVLGKGIHIKVVDTSRLIEATERPWDMVGAYVDDYEFRGGDGDYSPNPNERVLIEDAIHGYVGLLFDRGHLRGQPPPPPDKLYPIA